MKRIIAIILTVLSVFAVTFTASAKSVSYAPYKGYEYNEYNESNASPVGYLPNAVYNYKDLGLETQLDTPSDMVYSGGSLYILDSGNGRIVELDSQSLKVKKIYENFVTEGF